MLAKLDPDCNLARDEYERRLLAGQLALRELAFRLYQAKRSLVVVYEGWDASGKGGSIRRITEKLDPRGYEVYSIAAPAGEDKTHHYLWRFWRRLQPPDEKQVLIFDRSWYGRILVERVEGFASEAEWKRAYREINDFERQLTESDIVLAKFWLHISKEEQLRRFQEREKTPRKQWKLTAEDWRNREKWDLYLAAAEEILLKTSTQYAPWTVVEANFKWFARVKCIETLVASVSSALGYKPAAGLGDSGRKNRGKS